MSRNLGQINCARCRGPVKTTEPKRLITRDDTKVYFDEYEGMSVAHAVCEWCGALYLAWLSGPPGWGGSYFSGEPGTIMDLSFRYAFNDEPDPRDLPAATIVFQAGAMAPTIIPT